MAAATVLAAVALLPRTRALEAVQEVDEWLLTTVVAHRRRVMRRPAKALTVLAEPPVVALTWSVAALFSLRRGVPAVAAIRSVTRAATGVAARRALAESIRRPRPRWEWWWAEPSGFSYPSRHVTWALLGFGAAADLLLAAGARPATTKPVIAGATGLVAATRVLLALHWPSDVVAAAAMGTAWRHLTGTSAVDAPGSASCAARPRRSGPSHPVSPRIPVVR